MKYYVVREHSRVHSSIIQIKRTKCTDDWTRVNNYKNCWQFSKEGAKKICDRENKADKGWYKYYMIDVQSLEDANS